MGSQGWKEEKLNFDGSYGREMEEMVIGELVSVMRERSTKKLAISQIGVRAIPSSGRSQVLCSKELAVSYPVVFHLKIEFLEPYSCCSGVTQSSLPILTVTLLFVVRKNRPEDEEC